MVGSVFKKLTFLQSFMLQSAVCTLGGLSGMTHYQLKPIKLGAEVRGIDLKQDIDPKIIEQIKKDVTKHRILVFKVCIPV